MRDLLGWGRVGWSDTGGKFVGGGIIHYTTRTSNMVLPSGHSSRYRLGSVLLNFSDRTWSIFKRDATVRLMVEVYSRNVNCWLMVIRSQNG